MRGGGGLAALQSQAMLYGRFSKLDVASTASSLHLETNLENPSP